MHILSLILTFHFVYHKPPDSSRWPCVTLQQRPWTHRTRSISGRQKRHHAIDDERHATLLDDHHEPYCYQRTRKSWRIKEAFDDTMWTLILHSMGLLRDFPLSQRKQQQRTEIEQDSVVWKQRRQRICRNDTRFVCIDFSSVVWSLCEIS